jgi:hypothetical protein
MVHALISFDETRHYAFPSVKTPDRSALASVNALASGRGCLSASPSTKTHPSPIPLALSSKTNTKVSTSITVLPRCCDSFSDLYDANGNPLRHLYSGITGAGDGSVYTVDDNYEQVSLIAQ